MQIVFLRLVKETLSRALSENIATEIVAVLDLWTTFTNSGLGTLTADVSAFYSFPKIS